MKSKIPCEPGPAPLMKLAQATGLCGGMLVPSLRKPPCRAKPVEIGQQAGLHHALRQAGIHPVDADRRSRCLPPLLRDAAVGCRASSADAQPRDARRAAAAAERFSTARRFSLPHGRSRVIMTPAVKATSCVAGLPSSAVSPTCQRLAVHVCREPARRTGPAPSARCPSAAGVSVSIGRLQNSTPGTSDGSTQWSPLQAFVLVWKTSLGDLADGRLPRGAIAALVADDQVGARPLCTARGRLPTRGRPVLTALCAVLRIDQRGESLGDLRRECGRLRAPASTIPCDYRPLRLMKMPARPTAKARVWDQSTPARCSSPRRPSCTFR